MTVVPIRKPPSKADAQTLIRTYASEGKVKFSEHCRSRKKQRGINSLQIMSCLLKGYVVEDPFMGLQQNGWETAVTGTVAGEKIKVAVCLRFSNDVLVITCY